MPRSKQEIYDDATDDGEVLTDDQINERFEAERDDSKPEHSSEEDEEKS